MSRGKSARVRRVYTAIIRDDQVLMVRHVHDGRDYWTLPGVGVESGETPIEAAERELKEETGLAPTSLRELFRESDEVCFLAGCHDDAQPIIGIDPELVGSHQMIVDVAWFTLRDKAKDLQVSKVLRCLDTPVTK